MKNTDLLFQYVDGSDDAYGWEKIQDSPFEIFNIYSQTWKDHLWEHKIYKIQPINPQPGNLVIVYLTGDEVMQSDLPYAKLMANHCQCTVYVVFGIPNQPIWDMREDDLIAHTFQKFIETGETDWPLLFPMTKAAISGIDFAELQERRDGNPNPKFLVTGASKRGWTTWLAAATGDKRIVGIAPMVFDFLNFREQMKAMELDWGGYSPMHEDYSRRSLQELSQTPKGIDLIKSVDPYTFRDSIKIPKLIISGSNDPFWLANASEYYLSRLPGPSILLIIPNAGHEMGDGTHKFRALAAFADSLRDNFNLPEIKIQVKDQIATVTYDRTPTRVTIWLNESNTRWFADTKFHKIGNYRASSSGIMNFTIPKRPKCQALFAQAEFKGKKDSFTLTSPVIVIDPIF